MYVLKGYVEQLEPGDWAEALEPGENRNTVRARLQRAAAEAGTGQSSSARAGTWCTSRSCPASPGTLRLWGDWPMRR